MHVRYDQAVGERRIDRDAWADVVAQLIAQETGGNTSRFAQLVGVTYRTVRRWLTKGGDVSEESVRQVARAVHIPTAELLLRVGFYDAADLATGGEITPADARDDPALQIILEADVPPRVKQRMIQRLQQLRAQEAERQADDVRWWIEQAKGDG